LLVYLTIKTDCIRILNYSLHIITQLVSVFKCIKVKISEYMISNCITFKMVEQNLLLNPNPKPYFSWVFNIIPFPIAAPRNTLHIVYPIQFTDFFYFKLCNSLLMVNRHKAPGTLTCLKLLWHKGTVKFQELIFSVYRWEWWLLRGKWWNL